jgi:hypothetical protein
MIVITSIFVAEVEGRLRSGRPETMNCDLPYEDLPVEEGRGMLTDTARELISMYEGKNRVEPME